LPWITPRRGRLPTATCRPPRPASRRSSPCHSTLFVAGNFDNTPMHFRNNHCPCKLFQCKSKSSSTSAFLHRIMNYAILVCSASFHSLLFYITITSGISSKYTFF
jgi:hypothetical protein